jgi:undecaprenyl-diphosphatase
LSSGRSTLISSQSVLDQSPTRVHPGHRLSLDFPVLDKEPGKIGRRLAALGDGHPVWTYVLGIVGAFVAIATLSTVAGVVVTHVLLHIHGVAADDGSFVRFLARHRSGGLTEASLVGSTMAGRVVLPIIAVTGALIALVAKHWRLAGFLAFALALESSSYRTTTLLVHRHRPYVHRLEHLPVNASYPSGHTAASIAIYCGIALLLTSRIKNRAAQVAIWTVAVSIPVFVAFCRMYRGMHHPLDVLGGAIVGIAAVTALVVVSRASRSAAQ